MNHILPESTQVSKESTKGEIAAAIFVFYDEQCEVLFTNGFDLFMN